MSAASQSGLRKRKNQLKRCSDDLALANGQNHKHEQKNEKVQEIPLYGTRKWVFRIWYE